MQSNLAMLETTNPTSDYLNACKALGDASRMSVLRLLGQGSFSVLEICDILSIKQSSMSHHLKRLTDAGLVVRKREGNSIFYARPLLLEGNHFQQWLTLLFVGIDETLNLTSEQNNALQQVLNERQAACQAFFARHASEFKAQQDLIASYDQYGLTLESILNDYVGADTKALELGVGGGCFLPALATRFKQVYAIDISSSMLELAKQKIAQHKLENIELILQSSEQFEQKVDFISINMVMHHVPSPKSLFGDASRLLNKDGTLLVTDLYRHQQDWVKQSCGDLWLGFEPEELKHLAQQAGLEELQSQFLGLNNGFQIQFRLFKHKAQANLSANSSLKQEQRP